MGQHKKGWTSNNLTINVSLHVAFQLVLWLKERKVNKFIPYIPIILRRDDRKKFVYPIGIDTFTNSPTVKILKYVQLKFNLNILYVFHIIW